MKLDAYKRLIDGMVAVACKNVSVTRILTQGHPVRTDKPDAALSDEEKKLKAIFLRLSDQEGQVLARAFLTERQSGVHDFAAFLHEAMTKGKMTIQWDGQAVTPSPGRTMQEDFVRRLSGQDWEKR